MRVRELAGDLKVGTDVLLQFLREAGVAVGNQDAPIRDVDVARIRMRLERERRAGWRYRRGCDAPHSEGEQAEEPPGAWYGGRRVSAPPVDEVAATLDGETADQLPPPEHSDGLAWAAGAGALAETEPAPEAAVPVTTHEESVPAVSELTGELAASAQDVAQAEHAVTPRSEALLDQQAEAVMAGLPEGDTGEVTAAPTVDEVAPSPTVSERGKEDAVSTGMGSGPGRRGCSGTRDPGRADTPHGVHAS